MMIIIESYVRFEIQFVVMVRF